VLVCDVSTDLVVVFQLVRWKDAVTSYRCRGPGELNTCEQVKIVEKNLKWHREFYPEGAFTTPMVSIKS